MSPSMHVAIDVAIDDVGRDTIYIIYSQLCMWVCLCSHSCAMHRSVVCSCAVAAVGPQLPSAPESSDVHTVAITDSDHSA